MNAHELVGSNGDELKLDDAEEKLPVETPDGLGVELDRDPPGLAVVEDEGDVAQLLSLIARHAHARDIKDAGGWAEELAGGKKMVEQRRREK